MQDILRHKVFLLFFFLLFINLVGLDIWVALNFKTISGNQFAAFPSKSNDLPCPKNCLAAIDKTTASLKLALLATTSPNPQHIVSKQNTDTVKEIFVPLGSGTSSAEDWTDVPGVKAAVDSKKYGRIRTIVFEASVHVPNASEIVEVRLYNESDKHMVWNSDLFFPSGTTQNLLVSTPIVLDPGVKIYKVQIKTQLKFPAVIDQARIHITTD